MNHNVQATYARMMSRAISDYIEMSHGRHPSEFGLTVDEETFQYLLDKLDSHRYDIMIYVQAKIISDVRDHFERDMTIAEAAKNSDAITLFVEDMVGPYSEDNHDEWWEAFDAIVKDVTNYLEEVDNED